MKFTLIIFLFFLVGHSNNSGIVVEEKKELAPCPNSPNCVSTQEKRKRKRMKPINYEGRLEYAMFKLKGLISLKKNRDKEYFPKATLIEEKSNYLHYEFKTKIGGFIDDVEFLFDDKTKQIHFRSASRKGWGDFGKNKRRMKKIRKYWDKVRIPYPSPTF